MAFELPRIPMIGLTDDQLQIYWQKVVEAIEAQENAQNQVIADLQSTVASLNLTIMRLKIGLSYTNPSLIVTATDAGSNVTVTVAAHTRIYGDGSSHSVNGHSFTGKAYNTDYGVYYTDTSTVDTTPVHGITTNLDQAQNNSVDGRHFVAIIHTPAAAGAPTSGGTTPPGTGGGTASGGSYTGGSGGGGVLV